MNSAIISASILSADLARLADDVNQVITSGADWVHFDVMDHHYVENLTFGPSICQALVKIGIKAPIDVHLMVNKINPLIQSFAKAGANLISIHPQSTKKEIQHSINLIKSYGIKVGLVLNPNEEINIITPWLNQIDLVLVMSVFPGFAAQKFIKESLLKLQELRKLINQNQKLNPSHKIYLSIDGGINLDTIGLCFKAGANTFVSGSAIFKSKNYRQTISLMRAKINEYDPSNTC